MTTEQGRRDGEAGFVDLSPYIAWLAVRIEDEAVRRRCRRVAQAYVEWSWADGGPSATGRSRFVLAAGRWLQLPHAQVENALDLFVEYRAVVAWTIPVDG